MPKKLQNSMKDDESKTLLKTLRQRGVSGPNSDVSDGDKGRKAIMTG
jgi:hypothetical protein